MRVIRSVGGWALTLFLLGLHAGCEMQPEPDRMEPPPPETPPPEPAPEAEIPEHEMEHPAVFLEPVGGSGVQGEVLQLHEADAVVLVVDVAALPHEGEFPLRIHEGRCREEGPIHVALNPVVGAPDGTGSSRTALDAAEVEDRILSVHLQDTVGGLIACADL